MARPPPLETFGDALILIKGLREKGYEIYWHQESGRLVTRPKMAGELTMKKITCLLHIESSRDWKDLREKEGLD